MNNSSSKKVFLIYPPIYYQNGNPQILDVSSPPLGLLYLVAVLEEKSISVKFIDIGAEQQTITETLRIIESERPTIIGISAMTPQLQGAITLAEAIKRKFGDQVKICLGGAHISADPDFINRFSCFDFGVVGEAEITFPKIAKDIFAGKPIRKLYAGEINENLNGIPWPARHLIPKGYYLKRASLIAARGCPFNCYYCSRPAVSNIVRCRDPVDIVKEIKSLYSDCRGQYQFQDDSFTIKRDYTIRFCEEIIKQKLDINWSVYTRVDLVDEELIFLMAKAGCRNITFGIESGNERIREEIIRKRFTNQQIKDVLRLCRKYHIERGGFFMIGIPGETKKEIKETIAFMLNNDFNVIGLSIATPLPGSDLWSAAEKIGIINNRFIDKFARGELGAGYSGIYPVYSDEHLPLNWLYKKRRSSLRKFYLRPSVIYHRFSKDFRSFEKIREDVYQGLNILVRGSSSRSPYK